MLKESTQKAFNKAKVQLMTQPNAAFVGSIFFSVDHAWDNQQPTAYTDGRKIAFNEDYFNSLTPGVRVSLCAHEAWHIGLKHPVRMLEGKYDPKLYNIAADIVIDNMLEDDGFEIPPSGWFNLPEYKNQSTEQIYNKLLKDQQKGTPPPQPKGGEGVTSKGNDVNPAPQDGKGDDKGKPQQGQGNQPSQDYQQPDPSKARELEQEIDDLVLNSYIKVKAGGKDAGNMPGELEMLIDQLTNPKLPWEVLLQNAMLAHNPTDYSMSKPNRRYLPDMYIPSLDGESLDHIAATGDISCSVTDNEFNAYISEVDYIIDIMQPKKTSFTTFDTKIQDEYTFDEGETIRGLPFHGRGGTDLFPMMEHFKKVNPDILIVFSDLECRRYPIEKKPPFDVIWVCVNNPSAEVEFGTLIHLDVDRY